MQKKKLLCIYYSKLTGEFCGVAFSVSPRREDSRCPSQSRIRHTRCRVLLRQSRHHFPTIQLRSRRKPSSSISSSYCLFLEEKIKR